MSMISQGPPVYGSVPGPTVESGSGSHVDRPLVTMERQQSAVDMAFNQQLEKINVWVDVWSHVERCSILRTVMTWGRHRQFQFLRTVSVPALHRDLMYTAKNEFPGKPFVPHSTFYSRKLKARQEIIGRRKDGVNYHRVDSAHIQRPEQLTEILQELKLPLIPGTLSRTQTWSGESLSGTGTLSWGIQPREDPRGARPGDSAAGRTPLQQGDWPTQSPTQRIQDWSLGGVDIKTGTKQKNEESGQNGDQPREFKVPADGGQSPRRYDREGLKRSVTWSSLKNRSRVNKQPIRHIPSSTSLELRHDIGSAILDGIDDVNNSVTRTDTSARLPEGTDESRDDDDMFMAHSPARQRSSLSQPTLRSRKYDKNRAALRRAKTFGDRPSMMSSDFGTSWSSGRTSKSSGRTSESGGRTSEAKHSQVSEEGMQVLQWYLVQWNDAQRNEFLHRFMLKLDPRQHYFVSSVLSVQSQKDFISLLPQVIAVKILSYLSLKQLLKASLVCKRWHKLCNSNRLWKLRCDHIHLVIPVLSSKPNWKKIYQDNRSVKANWTEGRCHIVDCKGHTDRVLSVTFDERRMATGSVDKLIRVWNLDTGKCTQTLKGHLKGVWCLRFFSKNLLISGSYDCSIKVWNLRDSRCVRTMLGHEGPVWTLVWRGSKLVSGSHDKTARIWDVGRCYLLHILKGHNGAVYCADMDETGELAVTGSSDKTIRLWNTDTGTQCHVIRTNDRSAVMAVSWSHRMLACSFWDTIAIYRVNSKTDGAKCFRKYEEHYKRIESLELKVDVEKGTGNLISGGRDGVLKYWDISKEKSVQTYKGHNRTINCVHCDAFRIATASYDNKIKIWDFRS